jgi:metallo-beta-lactamase family protein
MKVKPQQTFIVHGEEDSAASLADGLRHELGFDNVVIPESLQSFQL